MSVRLSIIICAVFLAHFCLSSEPDVVRLTTENSDYSKSNAPEEEFTILCYLRSPKEDNYYLLSNNCVEVFFESDDLYIFKGSDENDVVENYKSENFWEFDKNDSNNKVVIAIPYNSTKYCFGINTQAEYRVKLNCEGYFWIWSYVWFFCGLIFIFWLSDPIYARIIHAFFYSVREFLDSIKSFDNVIVRRIINLAAIIFIIFSVVQGNIFGIILSVLLDNIFGIILCVTIVFRICWRAYFHFGNMKPAGDFKRKENIFYYTYFCIALGVYLYYFGRSSLC